MLRVSKLTDYATVVMGDLALHADGYHSAPDVAARTGIAPPTVAKVLKRLAHEGLLTSLRGPGGGYRLAGSAQSISVARIVRALEAPLGVTECGAGAGVCAQEKVCVIRPGWQRINQAVMSALESMTLADLTTPAGPARPPRLNPEPTLAASA